MVNAVIVRVLAPASGVAVALLAERRELGLLRAVELPEALEWVVAVLALDAAVYVQHRLFHAVPWLWPLHRLHHADRGFDFTTGVRFHPGEIALSALYKGAGIVALGASPGATLAFEIVLSTGSLFSHANARVAGERFWRLLLVTPDMHRVHHSTDGVEQNTNFGFSFSWWDRIRRHLPAGAAPATRDHAARGGGSPPLICSGAMTRPNYARPKCPLWVTLLVVAAGCSSPAPVAEAPAAPKPIPWDLTLTPGTLDTGTTSMGPQLTASPAGAVISWMEQQDATFTLRFAELSGAGQWTPARTVTSGTDWFVSGVDPPAVMRLRDGSLAAPWHKAVDLATEAYDTLMATSRDDGKTWSKPFSPHHDGTKSQHGFVSLFEWPAAQGGGLGMVWLDGRARRRHGPVTARGSTAPASRPPRRRSTRACASAAPPAWRSPPGGPVVAFRDRSPQEVRDIHVVRRDGDTWAEPVAGVREPLAGGQLPRERTGDRRQRQPRRGGVVRGTERRRPRLRGVLRGRRPSVRQAGARGRRRVAGPCGRGDAGRRRGGGDLAGVRQRRRASACGASNRPARAQAAKQIAGGEGTFVSGIPARGACRRSIVVCLDAKAAARTRRRDKVVTATAAIP